MVPYREYDKLTEVDQGAVVEHKRLSHVLQVPQVIQAQRDDERIGKAPSRTHLGEQNLNRRKGGHLDLAGKRTSENSLDIRKRSTCPPHMLFSIAARKAAAADVPPRCILVQSTAIVVSLLGRFALLR